MRSKPVKGMRDIRTMSDRRGHTKESHCKYLDLAMLEMGKARRRRIKRNADELLESIEQQLADIETKQAELLAAAGSELSPESCSDCGPRGPRKAPPNSRQGFVIKY